MRVKSTTWGPVLTLAITALLAVPGIANAEIRALLVGSWAFHSKQIPDLKGPPNDLAAMESLMRAQGATDVTVLPSENVTRTSMETAIHALGLRSKPGDWIVFYYSGHGAEAEAAVKGTVDGDRDQFIPLPDFDVAAPAAENYVVDKDFYAWIGRYVPRSVEVLMIADVCHSGTLNRSIDPRAWAFTPRLAFRGGSGEIKLTARPSPRYPGVLGAPAVDVAPGARADLPNEIYIGAAQDDQLALEASLPVEGAPSRGLLTYSFEQALTTYGPDGQTLAADLDHDGKLTVGELTAYLDTQIRQLTGNRQESSAHFVTGTENLALFKTVPLPPVAAPKPAVYAADASAQAMIAAEGQPWRAAAAADQADFVWDLPAGVVLRRTGDVIAHKVTTLNALRGVIEKWGTIEKLRPMLSEGGVRVIIGPQSNGARYAAGAEVKISLAQSAGSAAAGAAPRFVTVFNIASDGQVQTLYPLAEDGDGALPAGGPLTILATEAVEPYGADHVVALVTPERPDSFRTLLRTVDGQRASGRLTAPIRDELAHAAGKAALSIGELYTGS